MPWTASVCVPEHVIRLVTQILDAASCTCNAIPPCELQCYLNTVSNPATCNCDCQIPSCPAGFKFYQDNSSCFCYCDRTCLSTENLNRTTCTCVPKPPCSLSSCPNNNFNLDKTQCKCVCQLNESSCDFDQTFYEDICSCETWSQPNQSFIRLAAS